MTRSTTIVHRLACFLLAVFACLSLAGCNLLEGDSPTEPSCSAGKPSFSAVVAPGNPACDNNSCRAGYTLTSRDTIAELSWTFTNGSPSSSPSTQGTVRWTRPNLFPATFDWSVTACGCSAEDDEEGESCATTNDSVTFVSPN